MRVDNPRMDGSFCTSPRVPRRLAFFCPDVAETSTLTRAQQFIDHGYDVTVFGFRRKRYNMAYQPEWPHVPLGNTADGKYWQRLRALAGAVPAIFSNRRILKEATVFYARNIDQLYSSSPAQISGKAIIRAVPSGSSKTKTASKNTIVGTMYCMMPIVDSRSSFAPLA